MSKEVKRDSVIKFEDGTIMGLDYFLNDFKNKENAELKSQINKSLDDSIKYHKMIKEEGIVTGLRKARKIINNAFKC